MSHATNVAPPAVWGLMAEFSTPEQVLAAARRAREAGYRKMDAYSPFPIEGLAEEMGRPPTKIGWLVLAGAVAGGVGGFGMQWFTAVIAYPLNIGGRPYNSWPSFIPITFELAVLTAAAVAVFGMLALNGLPQPYHPVFNARGFERAAEDRFFLCIEAGDDQFDAQRTREFLQSLQPLTVQEVRP